MLSRASRVLGAGLVGAAALVLAPSTSPNAAASAPRPGATAGWAETSPGFLVPDDPLLREQWWLFNFGQQIGGHATGEPGADIRAPEAWAVTRGSPDVVVAILDYGIDYDHPEFDGQIWTNPAEMGGGKENNKVDDDANGYIDDWRGWDFAEEDNDPLDTDGHGTSVAGVVAAKGGDGFGITGIAPGSRIMPLRVGDSGIDLTKTAEAIEYAAEMGARIVVQSYTTEPSGLFDQSDAETAAMIAHPEMLFVTGAGNDGNDYGNFDGRRGGLKPCNNPTVPNLICVAGTDRQDLAWVESTFGAGRVGVAAPAESMILVRRPREVVTGEDFATMGSWAPADDMLGFWKPVGPAPTWAVVDDEAASDGRALRVIHASTEPSVGVLRLGQKVDVTGRAGCQVNFAVAGKISGATTFDFGLFADGDGRRNPFGGSGVVSPTDLDEDAEVYVPMSFPVRQHEPLEVAFRIETRSSDLAQVDLRIDGWKLDCWNPQHGNRDYEYWAGTSFATPLVAGVAALVTSAYPALNTQQIKQAILESAVKLPTLAGKVQTGGRLDAFGALQRAAALGGAPPPGSSTSSATVTTTGPASGTAAATISFGPHADYKMPASGAELGIPVGRQGTDPAKPSSPGTAETGVPGSAAAVPSGTVAPTGTQTASDGGTGGEMPAWLFGVAIAAAGGMGLWVRKMWRSRMSAAQQREFDAAAKAADDARVAEDRAYREKWEREQAELAKQKLEHEQFMREHEQFKREHGIGQSPTASTSDQRPVVDPPSAGEAIGLVSKPLGVAVSFLENMGENFKDVAAPNLPDKQEAAIAARAAELRASGVSESLARTQAETEYWNPQAMNQRAADSLRGSVKATADAAVETAADVLQSKAEDRLRQETRIDPDR